MDKTHGNLENAKRQTPNHIMAKSTQCSLKEWLCDVREAEGGIRKNNKSLLSQTGDRSCEQPTRVRPRVHVYPLEAIPTCIRTSVLNFKFIFYIFQDRPNTRSKINAKFSQKSLRTPCLRSHVKSQEKITCECNNRTCKRLSTAENDGTHWPWSLPATLHEVECALDWYLTTLSTLVGSGSDDHSLKLGRVDFWNRLSPHFPLETNRLQRSNVVFAQAVIT